MNGLGIVMSSMGGSTVLSVAVFWLARTWIGERLRGKIAAEYARELERLKDQLRRAGDAELERTKAALARDIAEQQAMATLRITRRFEAITACYVPLLNLREAVVSATTPFADHRPEVMQLNIERMKMAIRTCDGAINRHHLDLPGGVVALCRQVRDDFSTIAGSWEFHFNRSQDRSYALHMASVLWQKTEPIGLQLDALEHAMRMLLGEHSDANLAGAGGVHRSTTY